MAETLWTIHLIQTIHQLIHPAPDFLIILKGNPSVLQTEPFIKSDPLPDIKGMTDPKTGLMELSYNPHTDFHILPVICLCIPGIFIVPRNLIACIRIHIQHFFCNPQRSYGIINRLFLFAVNQKLCSRPRNPADAVSAIHPEQE